MCNLAKGFDLDFLDLLQKHIRLCGDTAWNTVVFWRQMQPQARLGVETMRCRRCQDFWWICLGKAEVFIYLCSIYVSFFVGALFVLQTNMCIPQTRVHSLCMCALTCHIKLSCIEIQNCITLKHFQPVFFLSSEFISTLFVHWVGSKCSWKKWAFCSPSVECWKLFGGTWKSTFYLKKSARTSYSTSNNKSWRRPKFDWILCSVFDWIFIELKYGQLYGYFLKQTLIYTYIYIYT